MKRAQWFLSLLMIAFLVLSGFLANLQPVKASNPYSIVTLIIILKSRTWQQDDTVRGNHGNVVMDDLTTGIRYQGKTNASGVWQQAIPTGDVVNWTTWIDGDQSRFYCYAACIQSHVTIPMDVSVEVMWIGYNWEKLYCDWYWTNAPQYTYACASSYKTVETQSVGQWTQQGYFDGICDTVWLKQTPWQSGVTWQMGNPSPSGHSCTIASGSASGVDSMTGDKTHSVLWACDPGPTPTPTPTPTPRR